MGILINTFKVVLADILKKWWLQIVEGFIYFIISYLTSLTGFLAFYHDNQNWETMGWQDFLYFNAVSLSLGLMSVKGFLSQSIAHKHSEIDDKVNTVKTTTKINETITTPITTSNP